MRVRIATKIYNSRTQDFPEKDASKARTVGSGYDTNIFDQPEFKAQEDGWGKMTVDTGDAGGVGADEQKVLDRVGEDLARLGRVKRVGLGVETKIEFLRVWGKRKR
jgi:hypothetical protein